MLTKDYAWSEDGKRSKCGDTSDQLWQLGLVAMIQDHERKMQVKTYQVFKYKHEGIFCVYDVMEFHDVRVF